MITRRNFLSGLVGIVCGALKIDAVETKTRQQEIREASEGYLKGFLESYVDRMASCSFGDEMKKNIVYWDGHIDDWNRDPKNKDKQKKNGKEVVVQGYFDIYQSCLDIALKGVGKPINEKEIEALGAKVVLIHRTMAKDSYLFQKKNEEVDGAYAKWAKDKVLRFRKIIAANITTNSADYATMFRMTFKREEAEKDFWDNQNKVEEELYKTFKDSLSNGAWFFGGGKVDETQEESKKLNFAEIRKIYSSK